MSKYKEIADCLDHAAHDTSGPFGYTILALAQAVARMPNDSALALGAVAIAQEALRRTIDGDEHADKLEALAKRLLGDGWPPEGREGGE